jgi:hypothetical protein
MNLKEYQSKCRDLTFMGPYIFNVFLSITNTMQRYVIFFFTVNALPVSSGFSAHHQELKTVHTASGVCQTWFAATASMAELEFQLTHAISSSKQV